VADRRAGFRNMADFNVRSDSVNVEQIMEQIRARIREKRGVDYTEAEIQELATARLEKFIDPHNVRSDLLQEFHRVRAASDAPDPSEEIIDESVLFETHRPWLRSLRKILRPILKLLLNTKALAALSLRSKAEVSRRSRDQLTFELLHNLVVEMTRLNVEAKNLTMRVESLQSRLEFNERRARALEGVVAYKPSDSEPLEHSSRAPIPEVRSVAEFRPRSDVASPAPQTHVQTQPSGAAPVQGGVEGPGQRSRRRRRRRGRRGGGPPVGGAALGSQPGQPSGVDNPPEHHQQPDEVSGPAHDEEGGEGGSDSDLDPQ
jgi:hypothetical protein